MGRVLIEIEEGSNDGEARSPVGISARGGRRLTGGSRCQRGKEETVRTGSGFPGVGRGPKLMPSQMVSPVLFIFFFFSFLLFFFCFLYSFISFSNLIQINSNQIVNFSKIQLNILR
jgi:hypothetical protein